MRLSSAVTEVAKVFGTQFELSGRLRRVSVDVDRLLDDRVGSRGWRQCNITSLYSRLIKA